MNRYAVGYINWYDYELCLEIVEAENEMQAIMKHSKLQPVDGDGMDEFLAEANTLEELKQKCFDADCMANAVLIE